MYVCMYVCMYAAWCRFWEFAWCFFLWLLLIAAADCCGLIAQPPQKTRPSTSGPLPIKIIPWTKGINQTNQNKTAKSIDIIEKQPCRTMHKHISSPFEHSASHCCHMALEVSHNGCHEKCHMTLASWGDGPSVI